MAVWKPLGIAAAAALLIAGSAATAQTADTARPKPAARNTTPYPAEVQANFMAGCTESGALTKPFCLCVFRNLERELTLAEFEEMDRQAAGDAPPPPLMIELARACYADNDY